MARETHLFSGIVPFVTTAETRSFREAARRLGVTTSSISKAIARLEEELGTRLLHRTSRHVALTSEGEAFAEQCRGAVAQVRAARDTVSQAERSLRGLLRVSMPLPLGRAVIMPALKGFMDRYPALKIHAVLTDRFVRFEAENVDVAVRIGALEDSSAFARRLRTLAWVTAAAPAYLERHGTPTLPAALAQHRCLKFVLPNGRLQDWTFASDGVVSTIDVRGPLTADLGEGLVEPALAGVGLIQAHDYMLANALEQGRLVEVLRPHATAGPPISVLSAPGRRESAKVRAFVAFVTTLIGESRVR
jgi:DNA-binding transcriptional LysR family regulator